MSTLDRIIHAHGAERLASCRALDLRLDIRGFLFTARWVPTLRGVRARVVIDEPWVTLYDYPTPGIHSELRNGQARMVNQDGEVIEARDEPRRAILGWRRQLYWDRLDFAYFCGYAMWNYLLTPYLFRRSGFSLEQAPCSAGYASALRVTFPDSVPTHSRVQTCHFDEQGLLRRLDYTAEPVGSWARAAHLCTDYRDFDGIRLAARRRVLPLFGLADPLPGPVLVGIDLHEVALID
jgi:hypothetical protein